MTTRANSSTLTFAKLCVFLLLSGKAILNFSQEMPYAYFTKNVSEISIIFGLILTLFALFSLLPNKLLKNSNCTYLFIIPTIIFILQSIGSLIKAKYVPEQIIEHTLQIMLPIILIYIAKFQATNTNLFHLLATATAMTFIGHGLFAIGWHYVPGNFIEMTTRSLKLNPRSVLNFLRTVGWLDLIAAILIFLPITRKYTVWYLIIWGILTSLARTYYVLEEPLTKEFFLTNIPNTIYRLPHGFIPILMWRLMKSQE